MNANSFAAAAAPAMTVRVVPASALVERETRLRERIARRAYRLFEQRGRTDGRDVEDWLRAESQFLRRFAHTVAKTAQALVVFAELPGAWTADQLLVGVEARRLVISGEREVEIVFSNAHGTRTEKRTQSLFHSLDLPEEVDPSRATASLSGMTLEIVMPQATAAAKR